MKKIWIFIFILFLCMNVSFAFSLGDINNNPFADRFTYSFNSTDLIKDHHDSTPYTVQILKNGKPVGAGENVNFFINGVNYTRTTNGDGIAALNINLNPGNYIVYCEYKSCKSYNNIMVI